MKARIRFSNASRVTWGDRMSVTSTWIEDVATFLQAQGFGTVNVDIMEGVMPDQQTHPNAVLAVVPAPGRPSLLTSDNTPKVYKAYAGVGLRFRDAPNIWFAPWQRANEIWRMLDQTFGVVIGSTYYDNFKPRMPPFTIGGKDETGRWLIGFDCDVVFNP